MLPLPLLPPTQLISIPIISSGLQPIPHTAIGLQTTLDPLLPLLLPLELSSTRLSKHNLNPNLHVQPPVQ
jgi:hypothetical protein